MSVFKIILEAGLIMALILLGFNTLYLFVFSLLGTFFYRQKTFSPAKPATKFYVLIPSFKSERVGIQSVKHALLQQYPEHLFKVVLIADSFSDEYLQRAKKTGAVVLPVSFDKSTKSRSINKALDTLPQWADYVVILDVDNIMQKDALRMFDRAIQSGYRVIQAHRTAKNLDTPIAVLDAISEEMNNTIFRKGQCVAGLNAALIGSGMVFPYQLFKEVMGGIDAVGGFDKELEMALLKKSVKIDYLDQVLVYDEKVQQADVLENQRKRWVAAQWHYLVCYRWQALRALFTPDFAFLLKYLQLLLLPKVIQLGMLIILTLPAFFNISESWLFDLFPLALLFNALAVLLAIPPGSYNTSLLKAAFRLPRALFVYTNILFNLKGANKKFIHTPHSALTSKNNVP